MERIKFSIVIPTRERAGTLFHAIATCTAQDYENLDIIVSDNFSQDNTRDIVDSFSDPRIKYINTGKRVSMSHNWEFALSHVKEGWVTIIGDDDGLLPGALSTVAGVIDRTGCQAITSRVCWYFWPGAEIQAYGWHSWPNCGIVDNNLIVPLTSGYELKSGRESLSKLMRGDVVYPYGLQFLYTGGFVDIAAVNQARGPGGAFFLSMAPDIYSAIALASVLDTYVMLNEPVAVTGLSFNSNGASTSGDGANLIEAQKYFSEENIPFHSILAGGERGKSIEIAIYESYLQSTHLHHDFLKIRLEDQLALALSRIKPQHYADLKKYCSRIALSNGINMDIVERGIKQWNKRLLLNRLKGVTPRIVKQLPFCGNQEFHIKDAREFGVQDISGAAFLAKAIFLLETRYENWKSDNFFQSIKKVFHWFILQNRHKF